MMIDSLRYFGFVDLLEFERMTVREYSIRMIAVALRQLDQKELIHQQAWANWQIQATETRGKKEVPKYRTFESFFDKQKLENKILGIDTSKFKSESDKKLMQLMKNANK